MRSATFRSTPQRDGFNNPTGGEQQEVAPSIQFDTKGVEFGPWLRRFVAQIRRNWFIPYAAMTMHGQVVVTFYVHKDGRITDVQVAAAVADRRLQPLGAECASWPRRRRMPLPPEYPDDKAFFTVTFFFNETPPGRPVDRMRQPPCEAARDRSSRAQQLGLLIVLAVLVALAFARAHGAP